MALHCIFPLFHKYSQDTPYLTLTGELWDVFCEYLLENWQYYDGTALYFSPFPQIFTRHPIPHPNGWAMGCLLWIFVRKLTILWWHCTVFFPFSTNIHKTPHTSLTLTGELWDVFCEYLLENWQYYDGTPLYFSPFPQIFTRHPIPHPNGWAMGCLLWIFVRKLTILWWHCTVFFPFSTNIHKTPHTSLTLTGELWDVFCEYLLENWQYYDGTPLYFSPFPQIFTRHPIPHPNGWAMGCLLWIFVRKLTILWWHCTVFFPFSTNIHKTPHTSP